MLIIVGVLLASVFIKCYYIKYTETWQRQHDVISFGADEGHAPYIEYILNNKKLPDFDPREKWAFFQPPLHHIISAGTMELSYRFLASDKEAQENTQIPTCAYMILLTYFTAYIFARCKGVLKLSHSNASAKLQTAGFITTLAIVGLHPMFIFFSGSINNDALALILSVVALLIGCAWYEKPSWFMTVLLALSIGFAMLAKLTGGLVAVPIGILMVKKFLGFDGHYGPLGKPTVKKRFENFFKKYFAKAAVFGIIVFPLGLSFSIYNKVKWGMPFNYIPPVGEQFDKAITLKDRLLSLKTESVYTYMVNRGDSYDEYSVPLAMVKTSLFGEYSFTDVSRWMKPISLTLFVSALILIVIGLIATVYMTFSRKSKLSSKWKIALFATYITYLCAYLYFALSSSNFSAGDFRYAGICIVCEAVYTGLFVDKIKNKMLRVGICTLALIFAVSSFAMFSLLGLKG